MNGLHDFLSWKSPLYHAWHRHPASSVVHWALFLAISVATTAGLSSTIHAYAQTADASSTDEASSSLSWNCQGVSSTTWALAWQASSTMMGSSTATSSWQWRAGTGSTSSSTAALASSSGNWMGNIHCQANGIASTTDASSSAPTSPADDGSSDSTATSTPTDEAQDASTTEIVFSTATSSPISTSSSGSTAATGTLPTSDEILGTGGTQNAAPIAQAATSSQATSSVQAVPTPVKAADAIIVKESADAIVPGGSLEGSATEEELSIVNLGISSPTAAVVSSPAGISCGSACSASFPIGSSVTLRIVSKTPVAVAWGGCNSSNPISCTITMYNKESISVRSK